MRILVTGSHGFIGTWLVRELIMAGHKLGSCDFKVGGPGGPFDLRVPGVATDVIEAARPEVVVHLAAKVGRLFGEDNPAETIIDNAGMTALVAQATGLFGARFVYASTSEIYGDNGAAECEEENGPFTLPHNVYGLSKGWGEDVAELYAPEGLTFLRFSMPYGPGLPAGRGRAAIINMLWQAKRNAPMPVHRGAERSWCWIGDTVRAARLAIEEGEGAYNVGRDDDGVTMAEVARMACEIYDRDPDELIEFVDAPGNQTVVKRLATKRIGALGWRPEMPLEMGMDITAREWVDHLEPDGEPGPVALKLLSIPLG